jgi:hypothetical protein
MTLFDVYQQARTLSADDRQELVKLLVNLDDTQVTNDNEDELLDTEWTIEEIKNLLTTKPMTGAEIVASGLAGGWADQNIGDGVEWVSEQRAKRQKRLSW